MNQANGKAVLSEDDLKEIYSLFTSSTHHERKQVYDELSEHYFLDVILADEYSLTEEKREFALDVALCDSFSAFEGLLALQGRRDTKSGLLFRRLHRLTLASSDQIRP